MSRTVRRISFAIISIGLIALYFYIFAWRQKPAQPDPIVDNGLPREIPTQPDSSTVAIQKSATASSIPQAASQFRWGGALNSVAHVRTAFFDHAKSQSFRDATDPKLRSYIVSLNARSFLPAPIQSKEAAQKDLFSAEDGGNVQAIQTVYIQFLDHPNDVQRAQLKQSGVELLTYMDGYAWLARGEAGALLDAATLPSVRALAAVDPHDKLHAEVYFQRTPAYAQVPDQSARFSVLAVPGTTAEGLAAQLAAMPEFAGLAAKAIQPSVLGPRFEIVARADQAIRIAAARDVAFIEHVSPPMANRDAVTDSSSNINQVRDSGPKLDGSGVKVAVREIGKPEPHVDYIARTTFIENTGDTIDPMNYTHATAVVGQLASSGKAQPSAKGVAPNVNVLIYALTRGVDDFKTNDILDGASKGARLSNHSYGPNVTNWGDYQTPSADWDAAIKTNNLIVVLAGNEEDSPEKYNHIDYFVGMKNGLCIEGSSKTANAGDPFSEPPVSPTDGSAGFAKYGPMNDGRVKPDLVAFGDAVTLDAGTNSTTTKTGTSFSTPATTGVAALIFQRYKAAVGNEPSAATVKALLCESASDLGSPGPDSVYGFGLLNASAAIDIINLRSSATISPFAEGSLANGDVQTFTIHVTDGTPVLKTTVCWMDAAGNPASARALVNDLDMLLTDPAGNQYFPYSLSASAPSSPATRTGPNTVDPIEQTIIQNPIAGTWTVSITGTSVPMGPQSYAFCCNALVSSPLVAFAQASPTSGTSPMDVSFSAAGSSGNITNYLWDFGDGTTGMGVTVDHVYVFPAPPAALGNFTAKLIVTDIFGSSASYSIPISVTKAVNLQTFPLQASGRVSLNKPASNQLQMTLIVPSLVLTPQQSRDAIANGTYEGKKFDVRVALAGSNGMELFNFLLDRHASERTITESFRITFTQGAIVMSFKNSVSRDLSALFTNFGIGTTTTSLNFTMRVQIETDDVIYQRDFNMMYTGKNGTGRITMVKN